jgi:hypothetical protein
MAGRNASGRAVNARAPKDVNRVFVEDGHVIDEALEQGVRDAMLRHKAAGLPVVIYRDGKTVLVKPEDLGY